MFERRNDGTIYVESSQPLGPYPVNLTECLSHWAVAAPDGIFLGQRDSHGAWRTLTYAQTFQQVRSVAQSLLARQLHQATPVLILGQNSIEHAVLALACLYVGVPYAPLAPSLTHLLEVRHKLQPALILCDDSLPAQDFAKCPAELVLLEPAQGTVATPFAHLLQTPARLELEEANARITPDTVAKILFSSGSTGSPKGVITTHRMLSSNQQMIRTAMPGLAAAPPVLCDWLPWNHVYGGSHNFGIALFNGGSLYIDGGRPTATGFATTLANLREIAPTAYFNVPKGYQMLVPALQEDHALRETFFSRLHVLFCAAAPMDERLWDELRHLACVAGRPDLRMMSALGATETAPMALATSSANPLAREVGLPVPGVQLKLVPVEGRYEARLCGPNITPGYWHDPETTAAAYDEEGFFRLGDLLQFADPSEPDKGFVFAGRLTSDVKLSNGTWTRGDALRAQAVMRNRKTLVDELAAGSELV